MCAHVLPPHHHYPTPVRAPTYKRKPRACTANSNASSTLPSRATPSSSSLASVTKFHFTKLYLSPPPLFLVRFISSRVAALGGQWGALSDMRKSSARGLFPFPQLTNKRKLDPEVKL